MDDLLKNKLFWIVIVIGVVFLGVMKGSDVLVDRIAEKAVQKLMKEYSPSPYGPGIDPDKIDAESMRRNWPSRD
jgi:hypothetical protein